MSECSRAKRSRRAMSMEIRKRRKSEGSFPRVFLRYVSVVGALYSARILSHCPHMHERHTCSTITHSFFSVRTPVVLRVFDRYQHDRSCERANQSSTDRNATVSWPPGRTYRLVKRRNCARDGRNRRRYKGKIQSLLRCALTRKTFERWISQKHVSTIILF